MRTENGCNVTTQNSKSILFRTRLAMVMTTITVSFTTFGYNTETVNGIQWNYVVDSKGRCILGTTTATTSYEAGSPMPAISSGTSGDAVIPQKLGGKTVSIIGYGAFKNSNLSSLTIPSTVSEIRGAGAYMSTFYNTGIKQLIFNGNAPAIDDFKNSGNGSTGLREDCIIYVMPSSTGWDVQIPGTWKTKEIRYLKAVDFDANGGSVSSETRWLTDGSAVNFLPTPTRAGYTFNGWFTTASGGSKISAATTVSADTTYYAHWTVNQYTITFHANGGTGGTSKKINYGSALGTLPSSVRDDYDFGGWFTETSGGTQISASTTVSGDATYYAHWVDPVPELPDNPTNADVDNALEDATDYMLSDKITTVAAYTAYRQWIIDKSLSHKLARSSPNAWLSYALDASELMAKATPLASEDITIGSFTPSCELAGSFDFVVEIAETEIGEEANLTEVFGVEGATELNEAAFSSDGLTVTLQRTADGKAKATVTPDGMPSAFFLRMKVK